MPGFELEEDFGVSGPGAGLEVTTTALLSCSAVVLYNAAQDRLGVFHYGACTLGAPGVQAAITAMVNNVQPTQVDIWPALIRNNLALPTPAARAGVHADNQGLYHFIVSLNVQAIPRVHEQERFRGARAVHGALVYGGVNVNAAFPAFHGAMLAQHGYVFYAANSGGGGAYANEVAEEGHRLVDPGRPYAGSHRFRND